MPDARISKFSGGDGVGIPFGNHDLVYEVNAAIDRFKATPEYADLVREYLSSSSEIFMRPIAGRT